MLSILPSLDSSEMAIARRNELNIPRGNAINLGRSAVEAMQNGYYFYSSQESTQKVEWRDQVNKARSAKISIPRDAPLPKSLPVRFRTTQIQIANETTFGASRRFVAKGVRPLALNFANGVSPGGGFLTGSRAQEEVLCRSSGLFQTLDGDLMYVAHRKRPLPDSTDWAIYSPDVPIFRTDSGIALKEPWLLSVITCAAPYAPRIGQPKSGDLLQQRIHRVLAIAQAYQFSSLVLGAWGCGAFGNDPTWTAKDFKHAFETEFNGVFSDVIFAIADWSPERRFLGPFRNVFAD